MTMTCLPHHDCLDRRAGSLSRAALIVALAALVGACATAAPKQTIELDPLHFRAVDGRDGKQIVETLDPKELFQEANKAFETSDYAAAARRYLLIMEHFPASRYAGVARFNAALSLERDGRCEEALPLYAGVIESTSGSKDAQDAFFRSATCEQELERWEASRDTLDRVLAPEFADIQPVDRLEAHAMRGVSRRRLGDLARAERDFTAALKIYRKQIHDTGVTGSRFVSMAQYEIGEIYRDLFRTIRFKLPVERMERDLEEKSNLFLKAQSAYLRTVRFHHPDYAVIAGYRLGALYEVFYDDMLAAEVPAELDDEEVGVYFGELRKKIRPLIERAIDILERNLRLSQRIGQRDEWVRKTEASLNRLREILRDDDARRALAEISGDGAAAE